MADGTIKMLGGVPVSDQPTVVDGLGRDDLASQIATVVCEVPAPFTIAVYGGWGEGKTSLLKNAERKICDLGGDHRTVWFDLWQHQDDVNPVLAMLALARAELDKNSGRLTRGARETLDILIPALWTALDHLPTVGWGVDGGFKTEIPLAGLGSDFRKHRDARRQARMDVLDVQIVLHRLFTEVLDCLAGDGRLVFFIDDLDRCLPEKVVDLLEKIRLFMDHEKCVFVVGADDKAVERAIQLVKEYEDPQIAGHYLEKMVQYAFDLPPVGKDQRHEYAKKTLSTALGEHAESMPINQIVDLWSVAFDDPEVDASVRLLVRTVNTFVVDHIMGSTRIPGEYDARIMAALSVIKTCYRKAYAQLRRRHDARVVFLWHRLFYFAGKDAEDSMLGSLFRRTEHPVTGRWSDQPGGREPEAASRIGWGFVQAVQDMFGSERVDDTFSRRVEAHFRLTLPNAVAESDPARPPKAKSSRSLGQGSRSVGHRGEAEPTDPPRPIERLCRLDGLVDYWTRVPSRDDELNAECARIVGSYGESWSVDRDLVRLSGIYWRVLHVADDRSRALLLADQVIGTGPYNKAQVGMTWERCDLRRWLNYEFLASLGELALRALQVEVLNGPNPVWQTSGGKNTRDQFFLLSIEEAVKHLTKKEDVQWMSYKKGRWFGDSPDEQGLAAKNEDKESVWWWLRSPGYSPGNVASVDPAGTLVDDGDFDSVGVAAVGGVRPAFWMNLQP